MELVRAFSYNTSIPPNPKTHIFTSTRHTGHSYIWNKKHIKSTFRHPVVPNFYNCTYHYLRISFDTWILQMYVEFCDSTMGVNAPSNPW